MDILSYGLGVAAIGMLVVFVALILLMLITQLMSSLIAKKPVAKKDQPAGEQVALETQEGIRPEIVAVIAAAIAEYGGTGLRITAVRPINRQESNWARAGRLGLMQSPGNRRK